MKKILAILLIILTISGCTNNNSNNDEITYKSISMSEAIELMKEDDNYILLDVRTKQEYDEGHIPGAINYPNENINSDVVSVLKDKQQNIYVYCRSGNRSKQASSKLVDLGYTNIIEIGGIIDYKDELEKGN